MTDMVTFVVKNELLIIEALNNVLAGNTIIIEPGEYYFVDTLRINAAGELNNPAVVISNGVTFNFIEEPYKSNGIETYGSYLQLTGGRIFCAGYKGLLICTINSIYSNIEVLYSMDSGLQLRNGGNIIKNCDSHDNFDYRLIRNGVIKFGFSSDGISDKLHGNVPNTFIGCRSWNNGDDGFDFFSRWTSDFTVLLNCWSFSNGITNINMHNHPKYDLDLEWFRQYESDYSFLDFFKTKVFNNSSYAGFGNGNGFKLSGIKIAHNVILTGCIAANNRLKGFDSNSNYGKMQLNDCIAVKNHRWNYGFYEKNGILVLNNCIGDNKENCFNIKKISGAVQHKDISIDEELLKAQRKDNGDLPDLNVNENV